MCVNHSKIEEKLFTFACKCCYKIFVSHLGDSVVAQWHFVIVGKGFSIIMNTYMKCMGNLT